MKSNIRICMLAKKTSKKVFFVVIYIYIIIYIYSIIYINEINMTILHLWPESSAVMRPRQLVVIICALDLTGDDAHRY